MGAIMRFLPMVLLFAADAAKADSCGIVNGSFENDGYIADLGQKDPNGWSAEIPWRKFAAYVFTDWPTDGTYGLTIHSGRMDFNAADMAVVSQDIDLSGVQEIGFDLKTASDWGAWDPNVCSAVVLIDGDVVWTSDAIVRTGTGEYRDQVYTIDSRYRTPGGHKLGLGLRINVTALLWDRYYTYWDAIECVPACDGAATLPGDFNGDCLVDAADLALLAANWLDGDELSASRYNLIDDENSVGRVDCGDLAVLGNHWYASSLPPQEMIGP